MGEIVNLRRARKARKRAEAGDRAAENRSRFGTPSAERDRLRAAHALDARRLDAHRLEGRPQKAPRGAAEGAQDADAG